MESSTSNIPKFDIRNQYRQWLDFRRAGPRIRIRNGGVIFIFWLLAAMTIPLAGHFTDITYDVHWVLPTPIAILSMMWIPLLKIFYDHIHVLPKMFRDDIRSGMMDMMFVTFVRSEDMVKDIMQKWGTLTPNGFVLMVPFSLGFIVLPNYMKCRSGAGQDEMTAAVAMLPVIYILWRFIQGTGLMSMMLPRRASTPGVVYLFWVIPVLLLVFEWGSWLAWVTWQMWFRESSVVYTGMKVGGMFTSPGVPGHFWVTLVYSLILGPITFILWKYIPKVLEMRRRGGWE